MPKRLKIGFGMGKGALMRGGRGKVMLCGPETKWGNPYPIANVGVYQDHQYAVERFRWAFKMGELGIDVTDVMTEMQCARWLACYCPLHLPCHTDVYIEILSGVKQRSFNAALSRA